MSWEYQFKEHILARGYHYYLSDAVIDLIKDDNQIHAVVMGTEPYEVVINHSGYQMHIHGQDDVTTVFLQQEMIIMNYMNK